MMHRIVLGVATSLALAGSATGAAAGHESPFACNTHAFTPAEAHRHFEVLGPKLRAVETRSVELPDGYDFVFPANPTTYRLIAEWAEGERRCCPFFRIEVVSEAEGGPLHMRLTGRPGVKDFIRTEGAAWIRG